MGDPAPSRSIPLSAGSPFGPGGAYVLRRRLGAGGMGTVFLARQTSLGRDVAIKILDSAEADPEMRERFLAEPRLMVKFPDAAASHVVPVLDCGTDLATGFPYYVMEAELVTPETIRAVCDSLAAEVRMVPPQSCCCTLAVETQADADASRPLSLADFLHDGHVLPDEAVARVALDILPALATLHGAGIVHRDLKPSNLLFSATGRLLLADFGIAKDLAEGADGPTRRRLSPGGQPGSRHYAAPEQLGGSVAVPATDYYALGVVVFRALTGGFPPPGSDGTLPADCPSRCRRAWRRLLGPLLAPDPARRLHDPAKIEPMLRRILRAAQRRRRLAAWWARHCPRIVASIALVALVTTIFRSIVFLHSMEREHHPAGTLRTVVLPGDVPLQLAWIPAGRFEVQGVGRTHVIGITRGFWMATGETTRAQWAAVMGTDSPAPEEADMPVSRVSWADATNFVARANAAVPGLTLFLPTEAEWELAARADGAAATEEAIAGAWHAGNSGRHPRPGRQLAPNAYGLHDMGGNVAEWCRDWNGAERFAGNGLQRNPVGPETGSERVCRGGSYLSAPAHVGAGARTSAFPDARMPHIGFRVGGR